MTNYSRLSKEDKRIAREAGIRAEDINSVPAIGFNALRGGIANKGIYLFPTIQAARAFVNEAPISRDIVIF